MKVRFSRLALAELDEILSDLAAKNPKVVSEVIVLRVVHGARKESWESL